MGTRARALAVPRFGLGLDLLSFFVAGMQTAFGPFVAVYLTSHGWTRTDLGIALSIGGIVGMAGQVPGGLLVDAVRGKRAIAAWSVALLAGAALLLVNWPQKPAVIAALTLQSVASCVLGPAIAALSLGLAGHALLGERLGRNVRFASIGNALASAAMGVLGSVLAGGSVFWLTAVLAVPALWSLRLIAARPAAPAPVAQGERAASGWVELRALAADRRLAVFALACMLFHLANAALMPLASADAVRTAGNWAELLVGAALVAPQAVAVLLSVRIGTWAETGGRRAVVLLGWGLLPVRAVLLALMPVPWLLPVVQAMSGVSDVVFGIMLPLVAADLTRGTNRFNLCASVFSLAMVLGGTMSTTLAGIVADRLGLTAAFLLLGLLGLVATLAVWLLMPETKPAAPIPGTP